MPTVHITANSRLSAALKENAILAVSTANPPTQNSSPKKKVIETPQAMTLAQWWQEWQNSAMLRFQLPVEPLPNKVLSSFEAQWLFEQCLQETLWQPQKNSDNDNQIPSLDANKIELLNVPATAKQLYQAWIMLCEYVPDWEADGFLTATEHSDETELFKIVLQRYLKKLKASSWQDSGLFSQFLLSWLEQADNAILPTQFELLGFDDLTPNMRAWIQTVQQKGCVVIADSHLQIDSSENNDGLGNRVEQSFNAVNFTLQFFGENALQASNLVYYSARDQFDEVEQVALWSLQQFKELSQNKPFEQIKIAVVAPDIAEYKNLLTKTLDDTLFVNGLGRLKSESKNQPPLYNLSLGDALLEIPLVENALHTLDLFLQPNKSVSYQNWNEWLISAYTFGDVTQRQQADAEFRRLQWANLNWGKLLATDAAKYLPKKLLKKITAWQLLFAEKHAEKVSLLGFVEAVLSLLDTLSWPGSRTLNSNEYQQKTAFQNSLANFSGLMNLHGKQSYAQWLSLLKRYLSEQVHQSQTVGHQPIQVMGMLEAGGQHFDAIWIMGLSNEAWPRPANPNPFIPAHLQRQLGMPRSDAVRELHYAQQLSQRLVSSAKQVFCSYPQQKGEAKLLPSAIFPFLDDQQNEQESGGRVVIKTQAWQPLEYASLANYLLKQKPQNATDFWQEDAQGLPILEGAKSPGGSGILQAQRKCPLMAYVDYRLGAKYGFQQVEESLQNNNQGSLIHRVLELFWVETGHQTAMLSLNQEQLVERLQKNIKQSFAELQSQLSEGIQKVEESRVLALCMQWLALESERESFTVQDTEKEQMIRLSGIDFKIIVDRIDVVAGETMIIDYKTGRASINDLLSEPLNAPQLAVYLFALEKDQPVAGIGYGLLHSDDGVKLNVMVENEEFLGETMHKKHARTRAFKVFAKMAEDEKSDYYQTSWQDFLDHLKGQVLELASQIQQGAAPMVYDKAADIQYAEGYLALRVPEVQYQLKALGDGVTHDMEEELA